MKKNTYDYFVNFENSKLRSDGGVFVFDHDLIEPVDSDHTPSNLEIYPNVEYKQINDIPIFLKHNKRTSHFSKKTINGLSASKMYIDLGIITPPTQPIINVNHKYPYQIFSQDVNSAHGLSTTIASKCEDYPRSWYYEQGKKNINKYPSDFKWVILYDEDTKQEYLQHMTPECFEELINIFLLGELRVDNDTHRDNYFLYKKNPASKHEGVIPIDMECSHLLDNWITNKDDFASYIYTIPINSYTPLENIDMLPHRIRIQDIQHLIQDGKLSDAQILFLKQVINYDLPSTIKHIYDKYNINRINFNYIYDPTAWLWEYNHIILDRELS